MSLLLLLFVKLTSHLPMVLCQGTYIIIALVYFTDYVLHKKVHGCTTIPCDY